MERLMEILMRLGFEMDLLKVKQREIQMEIRLRLEIGWETPRGRQTDLLKGLRLRMDSEMGLRLETGWVTQRG